MSEEQEGWAVDARPAVRGLAIFVAVLLTLVTGAGAFYVHRFAPRTRPAPHAFPAPRLELTETAPKDQIEPSPPLPPPGIARAMAETDARGDALWDMK